MSSIVDKRKIKLEEHIPLFKGRPDRELSINDIINLKTLLNISTTFEEFLKNV